MTPDRSGFPREGLERVVRENLDNYVEGAYDVRPWGRWDALSVKVENDVVVECEKRITVNPTPMGILSLQMHEQRDEVWTVEKGTLTVLLNGEKITVGEGNQIFIPRGAIHCMVNETNEPVIVHEIQRGICREADNHRLEDAHGRKDDVNDNVHADTFLKTMASRHEAGDDKIEGDKLMDIFMNEKPSERKTSFVAILTQSREAYAPFAKVVANYNHQPVSVGKKCG